MRKDDVTLGAITIYRQEVRPFTEKQIALLENFAAQAVIAMENARLITEQREALEQQTATAEVLQVINASPGNLAPVFDAMLEKAMRLCGAAFGSLYTYDGERIHSVAQRGVPESYAEFRAANPTEIRPLSGPARLLETRRPVHILDVRNWESYVVGNPVARALADLGGARSNLLVPLLKDDAVLGIISIYRQEVRAFSNKEIALLENFAAQAVIAMENARLLGELQQRTADLEELLDYQTATSDVLKVISRSTFDLQPVLDTVVETAARLCDADQAAIFRSDGELRWLAANHGYSPEYEASMRALGMFRIPPNSPMPGARAGLERKPVHIPDVTTVPGYSDVSIRLGGTRTALGVPLLRGDEAIGSIALSRRRIEPFTDRQIEIVRTFADQAVIAIENTRLITEQQEALEQQTATAEVLQVINASPGNLMPVFDAVLEKALRLCESAFGTLHTYDGECISTAATRGMPQRLVEFLRHPIRPAPGMGFYRIIQGEDVVHTADLTDDEVYRSGNPARVALVDLGGARTQLLVALRKDNNLLGMINVYRQEVRPFSDRQIALLENFAAQAVIAMENARLLNEIRAAPGRTARHLREHGRRRRHVRRNTAPGRMEPQVPGYPRSARRRARRAARRFADYIRYLTERGEFGAGRRPGRSRFAASPRMPVNIAPMSARARTGGSSKSAITRCRAAASC